MKNTNQRKKQNAISLFLAGKKLILLLALTTSLSAFAQFNQRWIGTSTMNNFHTLTDGVCTKENYSGSSSSFYNVAVGFTTPSPSPQPDSYSELRFVKTNNTNTTVDVNRGYSLKDLTETSNKWFGSYGNSICEIPSTAKNAGYIAVGNVHSCTMYGSVASGGSDALITKVSNTGILSHTVRVDFDGGEDILYNVTESKINSSTFYACGTTKISGGGSSRLICLKFNGITKISWGCSYRINISGGSSSTNSFAAGYGICEDASGNPIVVGSFSDLDNPTHGNDALLMKLNGTDGSVMFTYVASLWGSDDQYRMIKPAADGDFLVGGYSNARGTYGMTLEKFSIGASAIGSADFHKRYIPVGYNNSRAFDIIERTSTHNYFIIGSGITGPTTEALMIKTDSDGNFIGCYNYSNLHHPEAVALDYAESTPGIRIFSNHQASLGGSSQNGYIGTTYFNGATCNACPSITTASENLDPSPVMTNTRVYIKKTKISLAYSWLTYDSDFLCNEISVACGSQQRSGGQNSMSDQSNIQEMNDTQVAVFPNPASDAIMVSFSQNESAVATIEIFNVLESKVKTISLKSAEGIKSQTINISDLIPGSYMLRIQSGNSVSSARFIKN